MAQTNYSKTFGKALRAKGVKPRAQYQLEAIADAKRGEELPQSKLTDEDIETIRSAQRQLEKMREYIKNTLSNEALANQFGVHHRTIEKILSYETWRHVR